MANVATLRVTDHQKRQFQEEGYFVLKRAIGRDHLDMLRAECGHFVGKMDAEMDRLGTDVIGITHRNNRYFISNRYKESPTLHEFIFSDLTAQICRATLGDRAYLFHEQFVVKFPEVGMKFGWHQDSGYVGFPHRPYLSLWCALDDVDEANGTVYILPFSRAGTKQIAAHESEPGSNDLIGYFGSDPGVPVVAPAGSIAVFSSVSFHRSGPNTSKTMRRVYLPQYSAEPIYRPDGTTLRGLADPFLEVGAGVRRRDES